MTSSPETVDPAAAFFDALTELNPDRLTACAGWTVHDLVIHMTSGAEEILRHLQSAIAGEDIPATRSFADREAPWRKRSYSDACAALPEYVAQVGSALDALLGANPAHVMPWSGRQMPTAMFRSHLRNEFALHRWDLVGSDALGKALLSDFSLTQHTVRALAGPLLTSAKAVPSDWSARLRSPETDDVVISSTDIGLTMTIEAPSGEATVESDADVRLLLLWNRFAPNRDSQMRAPLSGAALQQLRSVLGGY